MTRFARVITNSGHSAISSPDVGNPRALIFRQDQQDVVCDECCRCEQRCDVETRGYGCILVPPGDEKARVTLTGVSSATVEECALYREDPDIRLKATSLSGSGTTILPLNTEVTCLTYFFFKDRADGGVYEAFLDPDFCGNCPDCPESGLAGFPGPPLGVIEGVFHIPTLLDNSLSAPSCSDGNHICFGELSEDDLDVIIPDSQRILLQRMFVHTEIRGGFCPAECIGRSFDSTRAELRLIYSPVTDRFAGVFFSVVNDGPPGFGGDLTGTIDLTSVVAIIRGGLAGVRWSADISSTAVSFAGPTATRSANFDASIDFPHFDVCCDGGSQRVEDVNLLEEGVFGGVGAASVRPIVRPYRPTASRTRRRRPHRAKGCTGCGSSDLVFPTASQVKKVAGSRPG